MEDSERQSLRVFDSNYETNPRPVFESADQAFEYIYRFRERLWCFIRRRTVSEFDADDVLQETNLAIFKDWGGYRPGKSNFYSWAFGIASNKCADYYRKEKALQNKQSLYVEENETALGFSGKINRQKFVTPCGEIDSLADEHLQRLIPEMLSRLNPNQAKALRLVYLDSVDQQEAATTMGVSWNNFRQLLRRARCNAHIELKKLIEENRIGENGQSNLMI
jgi:RNA polymerase sigma factor (sigma-70 family)